MNDDEALVPIPPKEVPEQIGEAFEKIEKPNASINIIVQPFAPEPQAEAIQNAVAATLAIEDKKEEIKGKKQDRLDNKRITATTVHVTNHMVWIFSIWLGFVALCVVVYIVGGLYGLVLLPTSSLNLLIGSTAIPPILNSLIKLIRPESNRKELPEQSS
jgi:hypothetical protein